MIKKNYDYYLGLDIGTDSVGYAVTDTNYNLIKKGGEPMWGTHLFDATETAEKRRGFRVARRALDRRQQRIQLARMLFAKEITKIDEHFFARLDCSALWAEDKVLPTKYSFFNDENYTDTEYFKEYPTIHHLIMSLIEDKKPHDVRLVYLAVAWLLANRGHFLNPVAEDNVMEVLNFDLVFEEFLECLSGNYEVKDFDVVNREDLQDILKSKTGISKREKALIELFLGKKVKVEEEDKLNKNELIKFIAGGKVSPSKLFNNQEYAEKDSFEISMDDDKFESVVSSLGDDGSLIICVKKLYDWSVLCDILNGNEYVSAQKIKVYEQHKEDLKFLKYFIKKYCDKATYKKLFLSGSEEGNYVAYSYNVKRAKGELTIKKKASKAVFSEYLLKIVKDIEVEECDREKYDDMIARLQKDVLAFMPKQVDGDNRVIPYQLYLYELKAILNNASTYLSFLNERDEYGSVIEKIISIFKFRVPYYVGPMNKQSSFAWIERKAQGKIYPWNFNEIVDEDASENAFIAKLTNTCTYLPSENVLPERSILYEEFKVLNEINNLTVDGKPLSVEVKKDLFENLYKKRKKITLKKLSDHLESKKVISKKEQLGGIGANPNSLQSYDFFKGWINSEKLSLQDVENIIEKKAYSEDNFRFAKWLTATYPQLNDSEVKNISKQNFKGFGRLSKEFLNGISATFDMQTGEVGTIIKALYETNNNLMQLLSEKFDYIKQVEQARREYYTEHPVTLDERLSQMYVPVAVRRAIIRTFDIISEVVKANGCAPRKIFIEMARGDENDKKGKTTDSRRAQIKKKYEQFKNDEQVKRLLVELESKDDRALRGEKLFLYFMQLGKCMYTGESIDIERLATKEYDIDHIYPQCFVKDDSLDNKVLVLSVENGKKGNTFPIASNIRANMQTWWRYLRNNNLMSDEKYKRLTRNTPFGEEEKWGFINRQLVETRQSTKAIAILLKERFEEFGTEVLYVKARLAAEFRQENKMLKSRTVNDLHHAKDAYLNIIVGNVYYTLFTKTWYSNNTKSYSLNYDFIFKCKHSSGGVQYWNGREDIARVCKIMAKNNIHLTKYAFCRKGGLFDQQPLRAGANLVPRKKGLDTAKYGGYAKTTASFFALVKYRVGKKSDVMFMPVELLFAQKFLTDKDFAYEYSKHTIGAIVGGSVDSLSFPLGLRPIKINTVLSLDGYKVTLSGKSNGGAQIIISSQEPLIMGIEIEQYIKRLESFAEKLKNNPKLTIVEERDKITSEGNIQLYDLYLQKLHSKTYYEIFGKSFIDELEDRRGVFLSSNLEIQVKALMAIGLIFKTNRSGTIDLSSIPNESKKDKKKKDNKNNENKKESLGLLRLSSKISNWKKVYKDVRIVNLSASGIYQSQSCNLFDLL